MSARRRPTDQVPTQIVDPRADRPGERLRPVKSSARGAQQPPATANRSTTTPDTLDDSTNPKRMFDDPTRVDDPRRAFDDPTKVVDPRRTFDEPTKVDPVRGGPPIGRQLAGAPRRPHPSQPPALPQPPSHQPSVPSVPSSEPPASSSQPLRMISMKTPDVEAKPAPQPKEHRVQIRDLGELRRRQDRHAQGLGNLAPPRDERDARARRRQDHLIWGSLVVIVGSIVTLTIWFLAR